MVIGTVAMEPNLKNRTTSEKQQLLNNLRPILIWIRFLGIDLLKQQRNSNSSLFFYLWLAYGLLTLSLNFASQVDVLYFFKNPESFRFVSGGQFESETFFWNIIIDYTNHAIHGVGSHLIFFIIIRCRSGRLLEALRSCEHIMEPSFFVRLRKLTIFGVAYIIILVNIIQIKTI